MTTTIRDINDARRLTIEGDNTRNPTSVFIAGPRGLTVEFDRATFLDAVRREFGLVDPLEVIADLPAIDPRAVRLPDGCTGCPMAPAVLEMLAARA